MEAASPARRRSARQAWGSASGGEGAKQGQPSEEELRLAAIRRKLNEVDAMLGDGPKEADEERLGPNGPVVSGLSNRTTVRFPGDRGEILVVVGTSAHAQVPGFLDKISRIVDQAYTGVGKHKRVSTYDAMHRLEMGDDGPRANRVLHLAFKGEELLGCASSTFSPGWTEEGCGHWGLLAVDPASQNSGVATALVLAAERRLATVSDMVQIEYEYRVGDDFSERLTQWYEGRLGFEGGPKPRSGCSFRRCLKDIPEDAQQRGQRRRLLEIRAWLAEQAAELEESLPPVRKTSTPSTRCTDEDEDLD